MSIKLKIGAALVIGLGMLAVALSASMTWILEENIQRSAQRSIRNASEAFANLEHNDIDKLSVALTALLASNEFPRAFVPRDRDKLLAVARPLFENLKEQYGITHWYFINPDPDRTCFLRVHNPSVFGDKIGRATYTAAVETKKQSAGMELGKTAFALRVVQPMYLDGELTGYMEFGEEIEHFLGAMKKQTGDEFALLLRKEYLEADAWASVRKLAGRQNDWEDHADVVVADSTSGDRHFFDFAGGIKSVSKDGQVLEEVERDGSVFIRGVFSIHDAFGHEAGAVFVLHDITKMRQDVDASKRTIVGLTIALAVGLTLLIALLLRVLVFARLSRLEAVALRCAGGDFAAGEDVVDGNHDEIGRIESFFASFIKAVGNTLKDI